MSAQFGVWPPQGKQVGETPGARASYGRPKLQAQIAADGTVVSDAFGVIDNVVHDDPGVYLITLVDSVPVRPLLDAIFATTITGDLNATWAWVAFETPSEDSPNTIRVETRLGTAGTSLDCGFFVQLQG